MPFGIIAATAIINEGVKYFSKKFSEFEYEYKLDLTPQDLDDIRSILLNLGLTSEQIGKLNDEKEVAAVIRPILDGLSVEAKADIEQKLRSFLDLDHLFE